jgi:hypothetical protein
MMTAGKPGEVCHHDAFGQPFEFDEAFCGSGVAVVFRAGGMRVRRDCKDEHDHSDIA